MPLVLFTVLDNYGLTNLVAGCLLSNERAESYVWLLEKFQVRSYIFLLTNVLQTDKFQESTRIPPKVVFSDGDGEIARALQIVWPKSVHLLCRFHIAQNITRKLAGTLRQDLTEFMKDFWRVSAIENLQEYEAEYGLMERKWPSTVSYMKFHKANDAKWAFAHTHSHFVAGVSSTQRQEQVNGQIKANLMSNSSLKRIIDGFESVDKSTANRQLQALIETKLPALTSDPIIDDALKTLTSYAGDILREQYVFSLQYICVPSGDSEHTFRVSHKDHPNKFRVTCFAVTSVANSTCSCRKPIWHGIVCRHLLCTFRHVNFLMCPFEIFNRRWRRDFTSTSHLSNVANVSFGAIVCSSRADVSIDSTIPDSEDGRVSQLCAIAKELVLHSADDSQLYQMVRSALLCLSETVQAKKSIMQSVEEEERQEVRNPLRVQSRGRSKTGGTRSKSLSEKMQNRRKQKTTKTK